MPFDVAFSLDDDTREVWSIIFGELEGCKFDWDAMRWREPE